MEDKLSHRHILNILLKLTILTQLTTLARPRPEFNYHQAWTPRGRPAPAPSASATDLAPLQNSVASLEMDVPVSLASPPAARMSMQRKARRRTTHVLSWWSHSA